MDGPQSPLAQFLALYRGMSATQRWLLLVVPVVVACGLGATIFINQKPAEEFLLAGKVFSATERQHAEDALRQAGLLEYRVEGQKILVPKADVTQYNAALVQDGVPAQFGAEMENLLEKYGGMFVSDKQRQELLELAKARELSKIIKAIPGIEDASVIWERGRSRSFSRQGKVTATVSVRPVAGRDLPADLVQSLRLAVAGAIGDLAVDDVTVLNMTTGNALRADTRPPLPDSPYLDQIERYTTLQQRTIADALSFIPHVLVSVNVDLPEDRPVMPPAVDTTRVGQPRRIPFAEIEQASARIPQQQVPQQSSSREPRVRSNTPREAPLQVAEHAAAVDLGPAAEINPAAATPRDERDEDEEFFRRLSRSVHVNVSIPKDYYRAVVLQQREPKADPTEFVRQLQQIEEETEQEVAEAVARLIPAGSATDAVTVNSYVRIEPQQAEGLPAGTDTAEDAPVLLQQWGVAVVLGVLAVVGWWFVRWNTRPMPEFVLQHSEVVEPAEQAAAEREVPPPIEPWQGWVQENPQLAVAVLSRWITAQN